MRDVYTDRVSETDANRRTITQIGPESKRHADIKK